jgi:hypothetical protein
MRNASCTSPHDEETRTRLRVGVGKNGDNKTCKIQYILQHDLFASRHVYKNDKRSKRAKWLNIIIYLPGLLTCFVYHAGV